MSGFWDRRRAARAEEARAEASAAEAARRAETEARQAEMSDAQLLRELGLPDPDTLDVEADFKAFLTETVPARLKARALRRLWVVKPQLANLDGLLDYGDDFTDSATVVKNLQTAYQVGKGMLRHVEKLAAEAEAEDERAEEAVAEGGETGEAEMALAETDAPASGEVMSRDRETEVAEDQGPAASEQTPLAGPSRRRMQFSFPAEGAA